MKLLRIIIVVLLALPFSLQAQTRWQIQEDGSIAWNIDKNIPHYNHIEMSGLQIIINI